MAYYKPHYLKAKICRLVSEGHYPAHEIIDIFPTIFQNEVITIIAKMWLEGHLCDTLTMEETVKFMETSEEAVSARAQDTKHIASILQDNYEAYRHGV